MSAGRLVAGLVLATVLAGHASAADPGRPPLSCRWPEVAGSDAGSVSLAGPPDASPTRHRQLALFRAVMREPLDAPCRAGALFDEAGRIGSPAELLRWAADRAGFAAAPSPPVALADTGATSDGVADSLAAALAWMQPQAAAVGMPWPPAVPDRRALPEPLRGEIAQLLAAVGRAHGLLQTALSRLPQALTAHELRQQLAPAAPLSAVVVAADIPRLLPLLDREALLAGMLDLLAATQRLRLSVAGMPMLPSIAWQLRTPLGAIVVDTTGADNTHRLAAPLLLLDVGGNDLYQFEAAPSQRHLAVLLDHGGDDRYVALADGADPSAATLGYGILWDTAGDDRYEGGHFGQAAALFGIALLVDGAGANRFTAAGHAQGYALGGMALLLVGEGDDEYSAQTHAQGSAGPEAVALLLERGGDDRYTLENTPLTRPSPQLPTHNTSMGQGAGRGLRGAAQESAAGGVGILFDFGGNDRYTAQVFAQGAGFHEGLGLLVDGGGDDRYAAAWYAMGAAAHTAAGVLLERGPGHDRYRATHSTSLGAAHDGSVAILVDEGGDDRYALGDLGLGAAHDGGVALFADLAGRDRYEVGAAACRAFGVAVGAEPAAPGGAVPAAGLFIDRQRAGDEVVAACAPGPRAAAHQ